MGANFRGERDEAVIGCHPTRRAQTVAIEQAAGVAAIGQHDAGGTVPGLHMHCVVLVERLQIRIDAFDILPSRRDQHAQCTRQLNAARGQQFQHIIETRGIGALGIDQRRQRLQIGQQRRVEL